MFKSNDDGAGIAWREGKFVRWEKGLGLAQVQTLIETVPFPFVAHFRVATVGGVRPELTHPFPVTPGASTALSGKEKDYVLFHNGQWNAWDLHCQDMALKHGCKIPTGRWSDSRALAWIAGHIGQGFLEWVSGQRIITFGPDKIEMFGTGWTYTGKLWFSNMGWERNLPSRSTVHQTHKAPSTQPDPFPRDGQRSVPAVPFDMRSAKRRKEEAMRLQAEIVEKLPWIEVVRRFKSGEVNPLTGMKWISKNKWKKLLRKHDAQEAIIRMKAAEAQRQSEERLEAVISPEVIH